MVVFHVLTEKFAVLLRPNICELPKISRTTERLNWLTNKCSLIVIVQVIAGHELDIATSMPGGGPGRNMNNYRWLYFLMVIRLRLIYGDIPRLFR